MDTVYTEESIGYSRACVARGGYKDIYLTVSIFLTDKVLEESGHESGTYILEGKGGTVEEFEGIDMILNLHDRTVEGQGVVDNLSE